MRKIVSFVVLISMIVLPLQYVVIYGANPEIYDPGNALHMPDQSSYVEVPHDPKLDLTEHTISFWVKPNAISTKWYPLIVKSEPDGGYDLTDRNYTIWTVPDNYKIHYAMSVPDPAPGPDDPIGEKVATISNGSMIPGEWNHIVFSYSDTNDRLRVYLNGVLDKEDAVPGAKVPVQDPDNLYIGGLPTGFYSGHDPIDGYIADVRIYNVELTAAEIDSEKFSSNSTNPRGSLIYHTQFELDGNGDVIDTSDAPIAGALIGTAEVIKLISIFKNTSYTFNADDFDKNYIFIDEDTNTFKGIRITSLPINGVLNFSTTHTPLTDGDLPFDILVADIPNLTYVNSNTAGIETFGWSAIDSSDEVSASITMSIQVEDTGSLYLGDGSGSGGGGGGTGGSGGDGGGDDDTIDLTGSAVDNVIFGDGSGGGAGAKGQGATLVSGVGGLAGSGDDLIIGGQGNDVIFGDGFDGDGSDSLGIVPGSGGLGGAGGGGAGGGYVIGSTGGSGGVGAGSGAGGGESGAGGDVLIPSIGNPGGSGPVNPNGPGAIGGNSIPSSLGIVGNGGLGSATYGAGGGGGALGGATGGAGSDSASNGLGNSGANGDTNTYEFNDTSGVIRSYFTESVLREIMINNSGHGHGDDTIDGKGGINDLFGLGGNDTFIIDSDDNAPRTRIWDLMPGDVIDLRTSSVTIGQGSLDAILAADSVADLDGDGNNDDVRFLFNGRQIDIMNTTVLQSVGGVLSVANQAPTINMTDIPVSYTLETDAVMIDGSATISDVNNQWQNGQLTIQMTSGSRPSDTLAIENDDIKLLGTRVKYLEEEIATISENSGKITGNTALILTFNGRATNEVVQNVARSFSYMTSDDLQADREVTITVTDTLGSSANDVVTLTTVSAPLEEVDEVEEDVSDASEKKGPRQIRINSKTYPIGDDMLSLRDGEVVFSVDVDDFEALKALEGLTIVEGLLVADKNVLEVSVKDLVAENAEIQMSSTLFNQLQSLDFTIIIKGLRSSVELPISSLAESLVGLSGEDDVSQMSGLGETTWTYHIGIKQHLNTKDHNNAMNTEGKAIVLESYPQSFYFKEIGHNTMGTVDPSDDFEVVNDYHRFTQPVHMEIRPGVLGINERVTSDGLSGLNIAGGVVINTDQTIDHIPTSIKGSDHDKVLALRTYELGTFALVQHNEVYTEVNHWSDESLFSFREKSIVNLEEFIGLDDGISRGLFATYVTRALGLYREGQTYDYEFKDVDLECRYMSGIVTAYSYDLIKGYGDHTFRPEAKITREEAMVIYARSLTFLGESSEGSNTLEVYEDRMEVSQWAYKDVESVVSYGVFKGVSETRLSPKSDLSVAQSIKALENLLIKSGLTEN